MVTIGTLNGGNITITAGPAIDPAKTRFTLQGGTVEEYDIEGTLDPQWLSTNGFGNMTEGWKKIIIEIDIGTSVTNVAFHTFYYCESLTDVTFEGKDKATVQGMSDGYPFGLGDANVNGTTIHCTDGDIFIENSP